ncbi:transposable element Tcb1 transposase [Trichonephila clavipes]|nr:transposable element Tcb1 transposase [Trichonephila clavipes]
MNQGATNSGFQTTVQRSLLRLVLRSRRLVHAPMLTAVHQQRRLEFSHRYRNWAFNERRQVEFSDLSRFILHRTDSWWQIRHETSKSKHAAIIAGKVQAGGGSIMVGGIYQQDIAECHTTDSVRSWFKEHQDQFIVLPCPENSPDLNPINNLWNHLDRVVRAMDPNARNLVQQ